eukprot:768473-Hanusia_phi.AAC.2
MTVRSHALPFSVVHLRASQLCLLISTFLVPEKTTTTNKGLSAPSNFARFYSCWNQQGSIRNPFPLQDDLHQCPCVPEALSGEYFGPKNFSTAQKEHLNRIIPQFEKVIRYWEIMRINFCLRAAGGGACLGFTLERENEANVRLIRAAKKGKLEKIKKFVQMGADVNFVNEEQQCAILKAAESGHKDAVDLLVFLGADLNFTDKRKSSILHYAAYNGHTHTVETIAKNASWLVNASNNFGYTPLQYAAADGRVKTVMKLLQFGANVNHHDKMQWTALHRAAAGGHTETIRVLIKAGADVHGAEKGELGYKYTPLHEAVWCEQLEAARVLIDHGAGTRKTCDLSEHLRLYCKLEIASHHRSAASNKSKARGAGTACQSLVH